MVLSVVFILLQPLVWLNRKDEITPLRWKSAFLTILSGSTTEFSLTYLNKFNTKYTNSVQSSCLRIKKGKQDRLCMCQSHLRFFMCALI